MKIQPNCMFDDMIHNRADLFRWPQTRLNI